MTGPMDKAFYSGYMPDATHVVVTDKRGGEALRLLCTRCMKLDTFRLYASLDGLNYHIVEYHKERPFSREDREEEQELMDDDNE